MPAGAAERLHAGVRAGPTRLHAAALAKDVEKKLFVSETALPPPAAAAAASGARRPDEARVRRLAWSLCNILCVLLEDILPNIDTLK